VNSLNLLHEVHEFFLFLKAVAEVGLFTGAGFGWLIAFGYELQSKRRF
jgi:hypothetical protein